MFSTQHKGLPNPSQLQFLRTGWIMLDVAVGQLEKNLAQKLASFRSPQKQSIAVSTHQGGQCGGDNLESVQ